MTLTLGRRAYFADLPFADSFAVSLQHMCKHAFILLIETAPMLHPCVTHTHPHTHTHAATKWELALRSSAAASGSGALIDGTKAGSTELLIRYR